MSRFKMIGAACLFLSLIPLAVAVRSGPPVVVWALFSIVLTEFVVFVVVGLVWTFRHYSAGSRLMRDEGDEERGG